MSAESRPLQTGWWYQPGTSSQLFVFQRGTAEAGPPVWNDFEFGPAAVAVSDTVRLTWTEAVSALAGSNTSADTFSLTWTDSSALQTSGGAVTPPPSGGDGTDTVWPPHRRPKPKPKPERRREPEPVLRRLPRIAVVSVRLDDVGIRASGRVETRVEATYRPRSTTMSAQASIYARGGLLAPLASSRIRGRGAIKSRGLSRGQRLDIRGRIRGKVDWSGLIAEEDALLTAEDWIAYATRNRIGRS